MGVPDQESRIWYAVWEQRNGHRLVSSGLRAGRKRDSLFRTLQQTDHHPQKKRKTTLIDFHVAVASSSAPAKKEKGNLSLGIYRGLFYACCLDVLVGVQSLS